MVIERVDKRRRHDARRQEERRKSANGRTGRGEVNNKMLLFLSSLFHSSTHPLVQTIFEKGRVVLADGIGGRAVSAGDFGSN